MIIFKTPWIIFLIPLVIFFILWIHRRNRQPTLRFSSTEIFSQIPATWKTRFNQIPFALRLVALILFFLALAGPRSVLEETIHHAEGIDIVLAVDCSGSMAAEDFEWKGRRTNRLEVVKRAVENFIDGRRHDRIGLVTFAGLAYTVCPLTTDYGWLVTNLQRIELGLIQDGTAIGSALNTAILRQKQSSAKSKVIILLTDGVNNAGKANPLTAAKSAQALGIKVYTIGAGRHGVVPFPAQDIWGRKFYQNVQVEIDEKLLQQIAETTGGKYFRATDTDSLEKIYQDIDSLEKTKIEEFGYREYKELFVGFLMAAMVLLMIEIILVNTVFLRIP